MLFPSIEFGVFLAVVLVVSWSLASLRLHTARNLFLLAASLVFYAFWSVAFAGLLVIVATVAYAVGLGISRLGSRPLQHVLLAFGIIAALGVLVVFKYYDFLVSVVANTGFLGLLGIHPTYLELGIPVTDGPADVADFRANFSQVDRLDRYREGRDRLLAHPATFVCRCSRRMVARRTADEPDPCRDLALPLQTGRTSLRFPSRSDDGMGDFVVWRRDGLPAYQLVSVVMDQSTGVDTVVRGADLAASTRAQLTVAEVIGATGVVAANYLHHPLVTDRLGSKLSKRDDAEALRAIRDTAGGKARLERLARAVGAAAGLL